MVTPLLDLVRTRVGSGFDRPVGSKNEYQGPCPRCACQSSSPGHVCDRFSVFPDDPATGDIAVKAGVTGRFWCRNCNLAGDYVQWLHEVEGWDWTKIFEYLGVEGERRGARPKVLTPRPVQPLQQRMRTLDDLVPLEFPNEKWREHADKFARQCADNLEKNQRLVKWLEGRGVPLGVAKKFGLGWHAGKPQKNNRPPCSYRNREGWGLLRQEWSGGRPKLLWLPRGLTIPKRRNGQLLSLRIRRPAEDLVVRDPSQKKPKKYHLVEGSRRGCMITPGARAYVVVEAELDMMAVEAAGVDDVGGCAMGSLSAYPDPEAAAWMLEALTVLQSLDFEPQGKGEKHGNKFRAWWLKTFPRCKRAPLPAGKDPGELVELHGLDCLRSWIQTQLPPAMRVSVPVPRGRVDRAPKESSGPKLPPVVEELRVILSTNDVELFVSQPSGQVYGGNHSPELASQIGDLCFRPVIQEWLAQIGEEVVTSKNFMNPMEAR